MISFMEDLYSMFCKNPIIKTPLQSRCGVIGMAFFCRSIRIIFLSAPYLLNPLKVFIKLHLYVLLSEMVCRTHDIFADSRLRSHFKVMGFTLHFRVRSTSPEPLERFSLNHSGGQWLSGRVLDSRPRGCGYEPHRRSGL